MALVSELTASSSSSLECNSLAGHFLAIHPTNLLLMALKSARNISRVCVWGGLAQVIGRLRTVRIGRWLVRGGV